MIHQILKFSTVILLFAFISTGCQKDDVFELRAGDKNAVIVKEVDGIEFKFCLLNEQGEPATVFNEGENFTFSFVIKNNLDTTIYFDETLLNANGFFEVKNRNESFGKPYELIGIYEVGLVALGIPKGLTSGIKMKWIPDEKFWNYDNFEFSKNNYDYLKKGVYYTSFSNTFDFGSVKTDKLTFKINFKIK